MAITTSKTGPATVSTGGGSSSSKANGSGTSTGWMGGGGGNGGVSGAGNTKNSTSNSKSTGLNAAQSLSGSKSSNASAANKANSAKTNTTTASKQPSAAAKTATGGSKSPNAAAANASRLNAAKTALGKVATSKNNTPAKVNGSGTSTAFGGPQVKPQSIQGMINSQNVGRGQLAGSPDGRTFVSSNASPATVRMAGLSPQTAPNGSYYGPKGINSLNSDARLAMARSVGYSMPGIKRTPGDADMLGRMMMAESGSIRNTYGKPSTIGLQAIGDVVRNRVLSERFPDTVPSVLTQRKQFSPIGDGSFARTPSNFMATNIAESILSGETPPVVGNALNYGNLDTINNKPGYSSAASKRAFNTMTPTATIADARNPRTLSHTFGTIGNNSDVTFGTGLATYSPQAPLSGVANAIETARSGVAPLPSPRPLQSFVSVDPRAGMTPGSYPAAPPAAPRNAIGGMSFTPGLPGPMPAAPPRIGAWQGPVMPGDPTRMQDIPAPMSAPSVPQIATDPRVNIPLSGYPQPGSIPPGYFQQFAMTPQDMEGLKKQAMKDFSFGQLMEMRQNQEMLPGFMGPITRDQQRMAQMERPQQTAVPIPKARPPVQGPPRPPMIAGDPRVGMPIGGFPQASQPPSVIGGDPRIGMSPGSYPAAPQERVLGVENYVTAGLERNPFDTERSIKQFQDRVPQTEGAPASPGKLYTDRVPQAIGDQGIVKTVNPYTPPSAPPFRQFANEGLPPGYAERYMSPAAPAQVSDNPIQGPSNPSQEPEDPAVVEDRRSKYSKRGAVIGGLIAGPIGALVGGLLGDQMGKTNPATRFAIASNPAALRANVNSINESARGGGSEMQVTERGLRDVLTDPNKVLSNPEEYTNLEEMLAALAAGIDPQTGKPI